MAFTLIPEEPTAPAGTPSARFTVIDESPKEAPPDPSTSVGMEMGRQILSAGGYLPDGASNIAGAVNYVTHGGAPGSFESGKQANIQRHKVSQETNPRAAIVGDVLSAVIPIPGVAAAAAPRLAARAVESVLRWGGRAGQGLSAYSVWNDLQRGETPGVDDLLSFALGRGSGKLANVMKARRVAGAASKAESAAVKAGDAMLRRAQGGGGRRSQSTGYQGTGDPFSGPGGNPKIRNLSPEMQAKSDAYQAFLRRHSLNQ